VSESSAQGATSSGGMCLLPRPAPRVPNKSKSCSRRRAGDYLRMVNPHFIDFPIVFKMEMEIFALVVLQSIHDRRKKRRAVNRHLRGVAEEFQPISHNNTVDRKQSDHFSPSADGNGELKRMWKHLVSKTRSAAEVRRIRRAWERMVTSESSTQQRFQK